MTLVPPQHVGGKRPVPRAVVPFHVQCCYISSFGSEMSPQGSCVEGLVPSAAVLRGGAFGR
jgi:hypothetical protein